MSHSRIMFSVLLVALFAALTLRPDDAASGEVLVTISDTRLDPQNLAINVGDSVTWQLVNVGTGYVVREYLGEWTNTWMTNQDRFTHTFSSVGNVVYRTVVCCCPPPPGLPLCGGEQGAGQLGVGTITVKAWTNSPPAITLSSPIEGF